MTTRQNTLHLLLLGAMALACSKVFFFFISQNDPEGSNLLIVIGLAGILSFVSGAAYYSLPLTSGKKLLIAATVQIALSAALYLILG